MNYPGKRSIIIGGIIFLLADILVHILIPDTYWILTELHSAIEAIGAVCALLLALLILQIRGYQPLSFFYVWIICGLTGMGILDLFHSLVDPGESFVWLHSTATLTGGFLFSLVWLPAQRIPARYLSLLPGITFIMALLSGILSIVLSDLMPVMSLGNGGFTKAALFINLSGGLLFIAAAVWFIKAYIRDRAFDSLLFSVNSVLFGVAGILFCFSEMWGIGWWHWHAIRIAAYVVTIYYAFGTYKELTAQIQEQKDRAQRYLDAAASILAVLDVNESVVLINRKGCMLLGCREEEITGKNWFDTFVPERSRNDARLFFRQLIADAIDQYSHSEAPVLTKERHERFIAWHNTLLKDKAGNVKRVLISGEDVTDRKKAEEDLWTAHQMLEARVKERTARLENANVLLNEEIAQRRLTENALRKNDQQFEKAQAMAHVGSWEWDIRSNHVSWSDEVYRIYGYQPGEIKPDLEIVKKAMHPGSTKIFFEYVDAALRGERPYELEYSIFRKDGQISILHTKGKVVRDSAGRPVNMFGVVQDVTGRKRIEDALKESERRFRETLTTMNMIAVQLDINGNIIFANDFLSNLSGWEKDEIVGRNWIDIFIAPASRDVIRALHHKNCTSVNIMEYYDSEILLKNGQCRLISWSNSRLMDPAGNVIGITSIGADITARRLAEEKLKLAGAYNRSLIEASLDPLVTISAAGKITDVNAATEKATGYSREELIGTDFSEYFTEPEKAREGYQQVFREGKVYDYPLEISHRKGNTTPVLYNASVYRNEAGEVIGVFAAARDIAERKKMEDRIRSSLKEKEVLLQEIHHRVKNNMTVISSLLKLQADKVKDEYYKELFNESTNRIKTMALIHEKLYRSDDLARIVFNEYLRDMMDNIVGSYGISGRRVHLRKELERIILPLDTSIPCGLIVNELLSNSLKYAFPDGRSGEIIVSLRKSNAHVELTISDNGVGLPSDLDFRNTGSLGLNIVTALVKQVQGNIELHRERGTEFHITFGSNN